LMKKTQKSQYALWKTWREEKRKKVPKTREFVGRQNKGEEGKVEVLGKKKEKVKKNEEGLWFGFETNGGNWEISLTSKVLTREESSCTETRGKKDEPKGFTPRLEGDNKNLLYRKTQKERQSRKVLAIKKGKKKKSRGGNREASRRKKEM